MRQPAVIRASVEADLEVLMTWFNTATECRMWGGPNFEFPFDARTFRRDVQWNNIDSVSLVDADDTLLAFGQLYERWNRTHLARLAVAPNRRSEGLGKQLIAALQDAGRERYGARALSLFVHSENERAARLYTTLGFCDSKPDDGDGLTGCRFLVCDDG